MSDTKTLTRDTPLPYSTFQGVVTKSADLYLAYLDQKIKLGNITAGRSEIKVYEILPGRTPSEYVFLTSSKVKFIDGITVYVRGQLIKSISIDTVLKVRGAPGVRVYDPKGILQQITDLRADDIQLITDMRFLIERLKEFYQKNRFSFSPDPPAPLPSLPENLTAGLSQEQLEAVDKVFSSPVTYINGAPGTGKTKMVLSRCILRYMLNEKHVFLLAPTNNSLEQMLRGILPILKHFDIPLSKVFRLGTSSEEFAAEYPEVVGDTTLEAALNDLMRRQEHLAAEIIAAEEYHQKADDMETSFAVRINIRNEILRLNDLIDSLNDRLKIENEKMNQAAEDFKSKCAEYNLAVQKHNSGLSMYRSCKTAIIQNDYTANKLSYKLFRRKKRARILEENQHLQSELCEWDLECKKRDKIRSQALSDFNKAKAIFNESQENVRLLNDSIKATTEQLHITASQDQEIYQIVSKATETDSSYIEEIDRHIERLRSDLESAQAEAANYSLDELKSEYKQIQASLSDLEGTAKAQQKRDALVIAGTIDSALDSLSAFTEGGKPRYSHVFLDECGYTALAKGLAAFACCAPVTFLGDHKQLPPVCTMEPIDRNNWPVCLWSLPMAYYSECIYGSFEHLYYQCYKDNQPPSFSNVTLSHLNDSYRFGPLLGNILAEHIYTDKFRGLGPEQFRITILDAPARSGPLKRQSISEAQRIEAYLYNNQLTDFAILTPYKNQTKLLWQTLSYDHRSKISTVHRAQGCEWDTVILSVVDAAAPYYTDSTLYIGKCVLNTAISRTKKHLIIACDAQEWRKKPNQLISKLIQLSTIE